MVDPSFLPFLARHIPHCLPAFFATFLFVLDNGSFVFPSLACGSFFFLHTRSFNTGRWVGTIWNAKLTLQATCLTGQGRNWHHSEAWASPEFFFPSSIAFLGPRSGYHRSIPAKAWHSVSSTQVPKPYPTNHKPRKPSFFPVGWLRLGPPWL